MVETIAKLTVDSVDLRCLAEKTTGNGEYESEINGRWGSGSAVEWAFGEDLGLLESQYTGSVKAETGVCSGCAGEEWSE